MRERVFVSGWSLKSRWSQNCGFTWSPLQPSGWICTWEPQDCLWSPSSQLPPMWVVVTSCLLWQRWLADHRTVLFAFRSVEIAGRGSSTRSACCFALHWEEPLCSGAWNAGRVMCLFSKPIFPKFPAVFPFYFFPICLINADSKQDPSEQWCLLNTQLSAES